MGAPRSVYGATHFIFKDYVSVKWASCTHYTTRACSTPTWTLLFVKLSFVSPHSKESCNDVYNMIHVHFQGEHGWCSTMYTCTYYTDYMHCWTKPGSWWALNLITSSAATTSSVSSSLACTRCERRCWRIDQPVNHNHLLCKFCKDLVKYSSDITFPVDQQGHGKTVWTKSWISA